MDINTIIISILILAVVAAGIYFLWQYFQGKNAGTDLDQEEFSQDMRRRQIIDLREKDDFDKGHILGARNIPYSQLKMRVEELRRDRPVYVYEQNNELSRRASSLLKKEGFNEIYRLKGGYEDWSGRIKKNK